LLDHAERHGSADMNLALHQIDCVPP
jgi:hypothetical protein